MASPTDRLTFNEVSAISKNEERSSDLTEVRKDFYPALREYIARVKADGDEEMKRDPYSLKSNGLTNEIKKATQKANIIFEKRMRKILLMAMRSAYGGKVDLVRLTEEEKQCFDAVLEEVQACKSLAMDGQSMVTRHNVPTSPCALSSNPGKGIGSETGHEQMVLIRVLDNIPVFKAADRVYKFNREEVVYLPSSVGCELVRDGKAIEISR